MSMSYIRYSMAWQPLERISSSLNLHFIPSDKNSSQVTDGYNTDYFSSVRVPPTNTNPLSPSSREVCLLEGFVLGFGRNAARRTWPSGVSCEQGPKAAIIP